MNQAESERHPPKKAPATGPPPQINDELPQPNQEHRDRSMNKGLEYMFDTNAFDEVLKSEEISVESLAQCGATFFATHIQLDEINKIPTHHEDMARKRKQVRDLYRQLFREVPTESFVFDISRFGVAKLSDGRLYDQLHSALDEFKKKDNNSQDALIGETAIKNNFVLVTQDKNFRKVVQEYGGKSISFGDFVKRLHG